jgi:hypothetical protein
VRGSKIVAVGEELPVPDGAGRVDLDGKYVLPGLVALEAAGVGVGSYSGNFADGLDPYALALRIALSAGITTVNLVNAPAGSSFRSDREELSGSASAIVKLTYGDLDAMLVREPGLNYLPMPTRQIEISISKMREGFEKAEEYLEAARAAEAKKEKKPQLPREAAPYLPILENKRPTVVWAPQTIQIRHALDLVDRFPFTMILARPREGVTLASEIARRGIPVILRARGSDFNFDVRSPVVDREGLVPVRFPATLNDAGVKVVLLPYRRGVALDGLAGRDLTAYLQEAGFAVRGGLSEDVALEAITLRPARLLQIADRVGSLEEGKDADLLVLDHPPLDHRALVEKVYIQGKLYFDRETSPLYRPLPPQTRP